MNEDFKPFPWMSSQVAPSSLFVIPCILGEESGSLKASLRYFSGYLQRKPNICFGVECVLLKDFSFF